MAGAATQDRIQQGRWGQLSILPQACSSGGQGPSRKLSILQHPPPPHTHTSGFWKSAWAEPLHSTGTLNWGVKKGDLPECPVCLILSRLGVLHLGHNTAFPPGGDPAGLALNGHLLPFRRLRNVSELAFIMLSSWVPQGRVKVSVGLVKGSSTLPGRQRGQAAGRGQRSPGPSRRLASLLALSTAHRPSS